MNDSTDKEDDDGSPFTPSERKLNREFMRRFGDKAKQEQLAEMLDNYEHSRWLFMFTMKVAKWIAVIVGGIVAYKQLPGLLK